jgi:hypothetical protein
MVSGKVLIVNPIVSASAKGVVAMALAEISGEKAVPPVTVRFRLG